MANMAKLVPGQVLWTVTKQRMGNTLLRTIAIHAVRVEEVNSDYVLASWNGNRTAKFYRKNVSHWKVTKPLTVSSAMGITRLATIEERKFLSAQQMP